MARKPRDWQPGQQTYHIMARGNHRLKIFKDDEDKQVYRSLLLQVKRTYPFVLHAYCLMTNHVHLLIETDQIPLGTIMKLLNMRYVIYFNKKYRFVGHLFQGRYRSEVVDTDEYFLATGRYIHLNPVKAGMAEHPQDYPWSSCQEYAFDVPLQLVDTEKTLGYFKEPQRERYLEFLERRSSPIKVSDSLWEQLVMSDVDDEIDEGVEEG